MRSFASGFATAALMGSALAVLTLDIARTPTPQFQGEINNLPRQLRSRATITSTVFNNVTGASYYVEVDVGTPPQRQRLILDTGSSDTWMLNSTADLCRSRALQQSLRDGCGTTYQPAKSSSYKVAVVDGFNITYLDATGATGDYIQDNLVISGATINGLQMGLARESTIGSGLMGIGYSSNVASFSRYNVLPSFDYPNIIDKMLSEKVVSRKAYSLYLNDLGASTGSIIFGGLDTAKYHGNLTQLPVIPSKLHNGSTIYAELSVALTSVGLTRKAGDTVSLTVEGFKETALLDSGTTFTYLPRRLVNALYKQIAAVDDSQNSGLIVVDCAILTQTPDMTIDFGFGGSNGTKIRVPIDELIFKPSLLNISSSFIPRNSFSSPCIFGIFASDGVNMSLLGDTFLRSAYVVYDLQLNQIAIGQTNFNSTTTNLIEFEANATTIPLLSGVEVNPGVTQTGNANLPGVGSAKPTESKKSAAVGPIPAPDFTMFAMFGISMAFAILGGGWCML